MVMVLHRWLIINHQNCLAAFGARRTGHFYWCFHLLGIGELPPKIQTHRCAGTHFRVDARLTTGLSHETVDHREAEPGAHADWLGSVKRIKGASGDIRRHTSATVGDA
jgi:hypothetical protein